MSDQEEVSHAFAPSPVATRIWAITVQHSLFLPSSTRTPLLPLAEQLPLLERYGLTVFRMHDPVV